MPVLPWLDFGMQNLSVQLRGPPIQFISEVHSNAHSMPARSPVPICRLHDHKGAVLAGRCTRLTGGDPKFSVDSPADLECSKTISNEIHAKERSLEAAQHRDLMSIHLGDIAASPAIVRTPTQHYSPQNTPYAPAPSTLTENHDTRGALPFSLHFQCCETFDAPMFSNVRMMRVFRQDFRVFTAKSVLGIRRRERPVS